MRNKTLISLVSCLIIVLASCSESPDTKKTDAQITPKEAPTKPVAKVPACQLNMGWDPWEPYQYLTPEDEVKGLEIDLVTAMAKGAGCELKFVQKNWMNLLNGIRNGSIDLLAGASKTKAREEFALFSDKYRFESFVLYVRAGEVEKHSGSTLKEILQGDFKLGVTDDYIYGDIVTELQDDENYSGKFVGVPTTEVNYFNLIQNDIDGFLEDPFVAAYTIKRKGLQGQIEAHPIVVHSGSVSLMFSKKSVKPEIVKAFNESLLQLMTSGDYQKIIEKYSH